MGLYPGFYPGSTSFPGVTSAAFVGGPRPAPQGVRAASALLAVFTAKSGAQVMRPAPRDLSFTSTAPGGYKRMTCTLDWPRGWPPGDSLAIGSTAQVVDRRNGEVVWHGQVTDPGSKRSLSQSSQQVTAQGFSQRMALNGGPVAYVDRRLEAWTAGPSFAAGQHQVTEDTITLAQNPNDWVEPTPAVLMQTMPEGSKLRAAGPSSMYDTYLHPRWSVNPQDIVMVLFSADSIGVAGPFRFGIRVWNQNRSASNVVLDAAYSVANSEYHTYRYEGFGTWTMTNARQVDLTFTYDSTDSDAARDWWMKWANLAVFFRRLGRDGNPTNSATAYLQVRHIIDDVIGRWLKDDFDITQAIAQPTDLVAQATWWEGTTAKAVLDAMIELVPGIYYAVWEPDTAGGKPRFEVITWDREPRYIIPPSAAKLNLQGGGEELYNRCLVSYITSNGVQATTVVTGFVSELAAAGETRTLPLDLTGEGSLTLSQATKRGEAALQLADVQRTSGTALVSAPILDRKTGRMIEPWEIRPGSAVTFGDLVPRADNGSVYSATGQRDGSATFRLTSTRFDVSTGACELSLDGGQRGLFRKIRAALPV